MTAYEKIKAIRQNKRPTGREYIEGIFTDRVELHGDRRYGEDPALCAGIGLIRVRILMKELQIISVARNRRATEKHYDL